jgi:hypothetical protein
MNAQEFVPASISLNNETPKKNQHGLPTPSILNPEAAIFVPALISPNNEFIAETTIETHSPKIHPIDQKTKPRILNQDATIFIPTSYLDENENLNNETPKKNQHGLPTPSILNPEATIFVPALIFPNNEFIAETTIETHSPKIHPIDQKTKPRILNQDATIFIPTSYLDENENYPEAPIFVPSFKFANHFWKNEKLKFKEKSLLNLFTFENDLNIVVANCPVENSVPEELNVKNISYSLLGLEKMNSAGKYGIYYVRKDQKSVLMEFLEVFGLWNSKPVGKKTKYLKLLFTEYAPIFYIEDVTISVIPDVTSNGYVFSDGCGYLSSDLAEELAQNIQVLTPPSVFQIRIPGVKGVLAVEKSLPCRTIHIRPSMIKFKIYGKEEWWSNLPIHILGHSASVPPSCFLNNQSINLLLNRGISELTFQTRIEEYLKAVKYSSISQDYLQKLQSILSISGPDANFELAEQIQRKELRRWKKNDEYRVCCPVAGSSLYGIVDPYLVLEQGQCFIQLHGTTLPVKGKVAVFRYPCYHPGDILILDAVYHPSLHGIYNCIVFPAKGSCPHPHQSGGGDLDGDQYSVIFDLKFIPNTLFPPFDYRNESMTAMIEKHILSEEVLF